MSEHAVIECVACSAKLDTSGDQAFIQCPYCGREQVVPPREGLPAVEASPQQVETASVQAAAEPFPVTPPAEPAPQRADPTIAAEAGWAAATSEPLRKVGILLLVVSLLALVYMIYHVIITRLPAIVLVAPLAGIFIAWISISVARRRSK